MDRLRLAAFGLLARLPGRAGEWAEVRRLRRLRKGARAAALAEFEAALATLGPGSICLDLGANTGLVTERMAETGATVHAFEPDPWAFARLRERVGALPNVTLHEAAVGLADGTATLRRAPRFADRPEVASEGSSLLPAANPGGETLAVRVVGLPRFLRALPGPADLVKMDIEGAELDLLEALVEAPERDRLRLVLAETHEIQHPALRPRYARLRARVARLTAPRINLDWP